MASTNKTTNLHLSQFIATDKPSWLSDYNADMLKIDAGYGTAVQDAASAVSGAASASAAAQAAQTTANSAETRSTLNATSISTLQNQLSPSLSYGSPLNGGTGRLYIVASNILIGLKGNIAFSSKPATTTVSGSNTLIPYWSVAGNLFSLTTSTLADTNNKFYVGVITYNYTDSDSNIQTSSHILNAYYDGANTIIYGTLDTSFFNSLTNINLLWGNFFEFLSTDLFQL